MWSGLRGLFRRAPAAPVDDTRWIVADVETSGLDPHRDRLLAIAAVALHFGGDGDRAGQGARRPRIAFGDSFEAVLRQPDAALATPDKSNILVHGIGVAAQRGGVDPAVALTDWARYVGNSPLIGYHSRFDETVIERATRMHLRRAAPGPWLDLEHLCAALHGEPRRQPLDEWLGIYGIQCLARHQAAADALATAQLLLRLWPRIASHRVAGWQGLTRLAMTHARLPGRL